ncbi:MAG: exo-alpha-sialidase, partial [Pirellulales bacterium]|nr:exo-alpha-sialidase [Pirellulales bacterium]
MKCTFAALFAVVGLQSACLSDSDPGTIKALRRIYAPQVVGVPPEDACRGLTVMPDGEIRHYGFRHNDGAVEPIYISSRDCGLSWREVAVKGESAAAMVRSPWSGDFLTILSKAAPPTSHSMAAATILESIDGEGCFAVRSSQGPEGPFTHSFVASHVEFLPRLPLPLRHRKRWVQPIQRRTKEVRQPGVLLSDDDGVTWREVLLPSPPPHRAEWPHEGVRWQNYGCEPTVIELLDGKLWMLIRTSQDNHYESFSEDAGESWTKPVPSRFYATNTMPLLFRMSDNRLLAIWNNSTPLPELNHDNQPELRAWERAGIGEDFFTNRDVLHAAISADDGRTWRGFRELYRNDRRNDVDFRTSGGSNHCIDKSIHQSQAVELPEGKILLAFGQHPLCR